MKCALCRVSLRFLGRHPWQFGLAVLGIALGVAVVVAVDLTNASAQRALQWSVERMTGAATHQLTGAPTGIPESFYARLKVEWGYPLAAPRIEGFGEVNGNVYEVVGIDPFAEEAFQRPDTIAVGDASLADLLTQPRSFLAGEATARRLGITVNDRLTARFGGIEEELWLVGELKSESRAGIRLLLFDISSAQELLGLQGVLSHIDLILSEAEADELRRRLPSGYQLLPSSRRSSGLDSLTRGFRLNLSALSLLALIVGGFLIYNTMTFSVVQRRDLFGLLRAVGATRQQVLFAVMLEAALLGMVGTLLGLLGGVILAQGLVQLVTRTINDLYYIVTVQGFFLDLFTLFKGVTLGMIVSFVAAVLPAWESGRASPRSAMTRSVQETRVRRAMPWAFGTGMSLVVAGWVLLGLSSEILLSYLGLFVLMLGVALMSPLATSLLVRVLEVLLPRRGFTLSRLVLRGITANQSRTAAAVAALLVAVAASLGMGIMVHSFRATVDDWLAYRLQADIYISVPGYHTRRASAPIRAETVRRIATHPRIAAVTSWRGVEVTSDVGAVRLSILSAGNTSREGYRLAQGDRETVWNQFLNGALLISESFAYKHKLGVGDTLKLATGEGVHPFPITGVYYDYGSDRGTVLIARTVYEKFWSDRAVSALGLYLRDGVAMTEMIDELHRHLGADQGLRIRSNRDLRAVSLDIFDRTFTITQVLRLLAVGVAFIAVVSALMAIQLERAREFAIMRAAGLTPGQLWRLMLGQTMLLGCAAMLFALPTGLGLAWVLTKVINRQSFGWSIDLSVATQDVLGVIALGLVAAVLAALYPAWRIARTRPALALREE